MNSRCSVAYPAATGLPSGCCTWECHQRLNVLLGGSAIRKQLFELEAGICTLCERDMRAVFRRYKALAPADRQQELMRLKFKVRGKPSEAKDLLHNPHEGLFWQADHILPVAEGGGECSLDNLRTLCTPCHQKETAKLLQRLKQAKLTRSASGSGDIAAMFMAKGASRGRASERRRSSSSSSSSAVRVEGWTAAAPVATSAKAQRRDVFAPSPTSTVAAPKVRRARGPRALTPRARASTPPRAATHVADVALPPVAVEAYTEALLASSCSGLPREDR